MDTFNNTKSIKTYSLSDIMAAAATTLDLGMKSEDKLKQEIAEDHDLERKMEDLLLKHKISKDKEKLAKLLLAPTSLLLKYKDKFVKPSPKKKLVLVEHVNINDKGSPTRKNEKQSPQRGKIRPKSVSGTRPKPTMSLNNSAEKSFESKKHKTEEKFGLEAEKTIALEEWIMASNKNGLDSILKYDKRNPTRPMSAFGHEYHETDTRPVSAPVSRSRRFMNQEAIQTLPRPPSASYLKNRCEKEKQDRENFAAFVTEEANQLQSRCIACIDEANEFSKALKKEITYAIHTRGTSEKILWEKIRNGETAGLAGTGRRIEKMAVEVHYTTASSDNPTRLISMDAFFREHARLYHEIHRNRCLQPATGIIPGDEEEEAVDKDVARGDKEKKMARKLTRQQSVHMTLKSSPQKPKSNGTDGSVVKPTKEETEERLKKILQGTIDSTRILESQLRELRARGWNSKMTY